MVWQKTGYQDSIEYDPDRHVLRYGAYEFHGGDLGLQRDTFEIDPTKVKSMGDVYLALGADVSRVSEINAANKLYSTAFSSGGAKATPFSGKESWKNDAAEQVWQTINPQQTKPSIWGTRSIMSGAPSAYNPDSTVPRALSTQKLDNGTMQFTFSDAVPTDYDFVNRVSSMANALAAGGGEQGDQRPERRRSATGAF